MEQIPIVRESQGLLRVTTVVNVCKQEVLSAVLKLTGQQLTLSLSPPLFSVGNLLSNILKVYTVNSKRSESIRLFSINP